MRKRKKDHQQLSEFPVAKLQVGYGVGAMLWFKGDLVEISDPELRKRFHDWGEFFLDHHDIDEGWPTRDHAARHFKNAAQILTDLQELYSDWAIYDAIWEEWYRDENEPGETPASTQAYARIGNSYYVFGERRRKRWTKISSRRRRAWSRLRSRWQRRG